jgi:hypothetical protein
MAFLESAVVVYLRDLYYPEGFAFPLKALDNRIALTEILREAATMIMLLSVAFIAQKGALPRFAIFIYTFAVWDIFYYLFLYCLLSWPPTLFTWDILFLIPVTWTGPVLAPVINSLTMILLAILVITRGTKNDGFRLSGFEWTLLIAGSVLTITAYTHPYLSYLLDRFTLRELLRFNPGKEMTGYAMKFIPQKFNWFLFGSAELLFFYCIGRIFFRTK